jgi:hypothetical protein
VKSIAKYVEKPIKVVLTSAIIISSKYVSIILFILLLLIVKSLLLFYGYCHDATDMKISGSLGKNKKYIYKILPSF